MVMGAIYIAVCLYTVHACVLLFCCIVASDWNSSAVDAAGVWLVPSCEAIRDGWQRVDEEGQDHDFGESAEDDAAFNPGQCLYFI